MRPIQENLPPVTLPTALKLMSIYFPNLLELLFITVMAFPNASINGLTCKIINLHHYI